MDRTIGPKKRIGKRANKIYIEIGNDWEWHGYNKLIKK